MPDLHALVASLACILFCGAALYINLVERLLEPGRDLRSAETTALLHRWAALHAIRTALGLAASIVYLWAFAGR